MPDKMTPFQVFLASFSISSLAGLAALLRSERELSWRAAASAMLYSGMMGVIIALLWYNFFDGEGNLYFLLGVSGLAGIGGTTVLDFVVQVIKKGGVHISISPGSKPKPPADTEDRTDENRL